MQQQRPRSLLDDARGGFNLVIALASAHGMAILPFTRTGMGVWGVGDYGFWAMVLILSFGCMMDCPAMLFCYLPAWLAMAVRHRLFPDRHQHSRYQGFPWPFDGIITNEYLARFMEAAAMLPIGNVLYAIEPKIGLFVLAGVGSLGAKAVIEYTLHRRRVQASHDWQAEAEAWQQAMQEAQKRLRG